MPTHKGGLVTRKTLAGRLLALLVALMPDLPPRAATTATAVTSPAATRPQGRMTPPRPTRRPGATSSTSAPSSAIRQEHIDPAPQRHPDAHQVISAMYDGLTDIGASDPANPKVPDVGRSHEVNNATVWTFKIRDNQVFSNGGRHPITPTPGTFRPSPGDWNQPA